MIVGITIAAILIMVFLKAFILLMGVLLDFLKLYFSYAAITIPMTIFICGTVCIGFVEMILLTITVLFLIVVLMIIIINHYDNQDLELEPNRIIGTKMHII